MKTNWMILAASLSFGLAAPLLAHHSFAAEYDAAKQVKLKGVVAKVEWSNPHIWFYIDVKDDAGQTVRWQCEGGAPNSLVRQGWTRNSLKEGDQVDVQGYLAKDGTNTANARTVTLADGKRVFAGSADDGGPGTKK
jgi:hypothetical protein